MAYQFITSSISHGSAVQITNVTAGHLLVLATAMKNEFVAITSVTDTGNTWVAMGNSNDGNNSFANGLAYAENVTAGTHTVTPNFTGGTLIDYSTIILEYGNIITSGSFDVEDDGGDSAAASINVGPDTTQAANELVVAVQGVGGTRTSSTPTGTGLSFTQRVDISAVVINDFAVYDSNAASATAYTVTFATAGGSGGNVGLFATFRTTSGGGGTVLIPSTVTLVGNKLTSMLGRGKIV